MTSAQQITGDLDGQGLRIGIVVSRFNEAVTSRLLQGAQKAMEEHGTEANDGPIVQVPGSFEIPVAAQRLARRHTLDAIVCLGAIIHHETDHDRYLAQAVSYSLAALARKLEVPVIFGVLTTETEEMALARSGGSQGNKGYDAVLTAIEMATLLRRLDESEAASP